MTLDRIDSSKLFSIWDFRDFIGRRKEHERGRYNAPPGTMDEIPPLCDGIPGHSTLGECREPSRPEAQHLAVADEEARHRVTDLITDRKRLGKVEAAGVEPASFGREMCPLR